MTHDEAFAKLARSAFRRRFRLTAALRRYVAEKGMDTIRRHAEDFVRLRLAPAVPENDGRQTPMGRHPVFVAQHATATCCRGCLNRWWKVPKSVPLTAEQQRKIVSLIMEWIGRQMAGTAKRTLWYNVRYEVQCGDDCVVAAERERLKRKAVQDEET